VSDAENGTPKPAHRSDGPPSIADAEADLARTRQEMAATLDELSARFDVKARGREVVSDRRVQAGGAAAAFAVVALVAVLVWRRKR